MAHNIFHTGFDFIKDKTTDLVDNVKDFGTDLYVDYKVDQYVDSFTDEFKGPTTITPEMAAEGWKPGLDGVPYNSKLNEKFEPGGIFYDPDVDKNTAIANAVASGAVSSAEAGTEEGSPFLSQDLRQRTPSGTIYNPSMDDYNNASLFEYTGPGGLENYTYGEGLPTDYGIYGTPPGPNLYYEGQYGEGFVEPGVADTAITLPPITMPAGVPQIPTSNTNTTTNNNTTTTTNTGTYQSGMDSNLLNSYINETGIGTATQGSGMGYTGGVNEPGIGTATQGSGMGYSGGANEVGIGSATQGSGMGYSGGANEAGAVGIPGYTNNGTTSASDQAIFDAAKMSQMPDSGPSIYDTQYTPVPYQIGGEEQVSNAQYNMQPTDDGSFNYGSSLSNQANFETANSIYNPPSNNITRNPNEETQPYRGIYVDPRTVPEINLPETNVTYPPSFPAGYGDGNNMSLVTTTDEPYDDRLIMSAPMTPEEQAMGTNPELFEEDENLFNAVSSGQLMDMGDIIYTSSPNTSGNFGGSPDNPGFDELIMSGINLGKEGLSDGYKYITNLFSGDEPSAEEVAASVAKEPSIWNSVMEVIAGSAGMGFPGESEPVVAQTESVMPAIQPSQDMYQYDGAYASNAGSNAAIDAVIANSMAQDQAVAQASQAAYTGPSIFTQPAAPAPVFGPSPRPTPSPVVYNTPPSAPPSVLSRPTPKPVSRPTYTWKPSYAGGSGGF